MNFSSYKRNGWQVSDEMVLESSVERTLSGLETSMSVLELPSHNRDYFPHSGDVLITCEAAIAVTPGERHSPWTQTSEMLATLSHHQVNHYFSISFKIDFFRYFKLISEWLLLSLLKWFQFHWNLFIQY